MNKLTISNFTDPMMGLSYESEPFFRKLETHFKDRLELKYVMAGLVRDVYDFVDPADLRNGKDYALKKYNVRLARIYEDEEPITGMPINMSNFKLFSTRHTSSIPLNLAYKAAQLTDHSKADLFLYNLRYATIVECRPTTHFEEILAVVEQTQINPDSFVMHYQDGSAQAALAADFELRRAWSVRTLPAYLFQYAGQHALVHGVLRYADFVAVIAQLTEGKLGPVAPKISVEGIRDLINLHPLISPIEIRDAFGLRDLAQVKELIYPLIEAGEICLEEVHHGWFIRKS